MKTFFYFVIISIISLFFLATPSLAIIQTTTEMTISHDEPLFPSSIIWYPGLVLKNTIKVKNIGKSVRSLGIRAINTFETGQLAETLTFEVNENGSKILKDFWDMNSELKITDLNPNETKTIKLTIYAPKTLGNEHQNKEVKFDVLIGFLGSTPLEAKVLGVATKSNNQLLKYFLYIVLIILLVMAFVGYKKRQSL